MRRPYETARAFQHARFGELRAALQEAPSAAGWEAICELVTAWHGAAFEDVRPYVEDHLASWPDALRVAPPQWQRQLRRGQRVPQLRLTRALVIGLHHTPPNTPSPAARGLCRLLRCDELDHLTQVDVRGMSTSTQVGDALTALLTRLRQPLDTLSLTHNPFSTLMSDAAPRWQALLNAVRVRTLRFTAFPSAETLDALAQDTSLIRELHTLEVCLSRGDTAAQIDALHRAVAQAPQLQRVRLDDRHLDARLDAWTHARALAALPHLDTAQREQLERIARQRT